MMNIAKAFAFPAVIKVEGETHKTSNLSRASFYEIVSLMSEVKKEIPIALKGIIRYIFRSSSVQHRLILIFFVSISSLCIFVIILFSKIPSFWASYSEFGLGKAIELAFNYPLRHWIFLIPVVLYTAEYLLWNPSLDDQLSKLLSSRRTRVEQGDATAVDPKEVPNVSDLLARSMEDQMLDKKAESLLIHQYSSATLPPASPDTVAYLRQLRERAQPIRDAWVAEYGELNMSKLIANGNIVLDSKVRKSAPVTTTRGKSVLIKSF